MAERDTVLSVNNLVINFINFKACILQSLYRELGTILSVYVLRVTLDHDVLDLAIAVEVNLILAEVNDDLALHCS